MAKNPAGHNIEHADASPKADEKLPAVQAAQTADEVAARAVEYCPDEHKEVQGDGHPDAEE